MNGWKDFMLGYEIDKHNAGPRENNKGIIFSWLDEKPSFIVEEMPVYGSTGNGFNVQFNKH